MDRVAVLAIEALIALLAIIAVMVEMAGCIRCNVRDDCNGFFNHLDLSESWAKRLYQLCECVIKWVSMCITEMLSHLKKE